ncbi:MAG: aminotransferase class IV [Brumimicrobium sp.]|nr:aminotransferase class IV [Brumimicrobium sp.]MCO5269176.1 aminotransferase class IV [Brumimicrobium sp.]
MEKLFVNNNGEVLENDGHTLCAGNRGHLYGDGLFESIRAIHGKPINMEAHIARMLDGMRVLKMNIPTYFTVEFFIEKMEELLQKSEIKGGGKVRLSVDRISGGTYKPSSNEVDYFIEVYPLPTNEFMLNEKGIEVDLYTAIHKEKTPFSNYKVKNALLNVMASIEASERNLGDVLLTNNRGGILEATGSNIFVVGNGILYTPGLEENCVGGTMRMLLINIALQNNIRVYESPLTPQNLLIADEVFLTNAIQGITWVGGYRTRRYMNTTSVRLLQLLNEQFG